MTTALITQPTDLSLVALTPNDVGPAQRHLVAWCRAKIAALGLELREQRQNLRQAKLAKWKHSGWLSAVNKTKARMIYYAKIGAACRAGYLIVPNFECEVMAVRVAREKPPLSVEVKTSSYDNTPSLSHVRAKAELLPPGQGRYVDDRMFYDQEHWEEKDKTGETVKKHAFTISGYDEPDFPVKAIKPIVLEATQRAMALNIFDRIGVVTGRRQDPLVIGEILDPRETQRWQPAAQKRVSFFIAWWLDTRSL